MVFEKRKPKLWKTEEDRFMQDLIKVFGEKRWVFMSNKLKNNLGIVRTPKQCRDRWVNYLKDAKTDPFSDKEIKIILQGQGKYGNKWSKIAKSLPGRSENQVKNFIHGTIRRNLRRFNKGKAESEKIYLTSLNLLEIPEIRNILTTSKQVKRSVLMQKCLSSETKKIIQSNRFIKVQEPNSIEISLGRTSQIRIQEFEDWNIQEFEDITSNKYFQDDYIVYKEEDEILILNSI
ncbi:hypothetical protein SteCoe_24870 [Stentor coeruleus]|uniref:Myb-like DNA-binding domain containing protein n=1 Tax=Stentor coeruleus TaxID=5963 RepID=A0A1R2BGL4_9CILI|nr:hypothetical protein SteCoe_24870 [Stentor coeruleus]